MGRGQSPPGTRSRRGAHSGIRTPGVAPAVGSEVVWLSLDPRSGEAAAYPAPVSQRIEAAYLAGGSREVRLAGLGGIFECLVIDLGTDDDDLAIQVNPMTGGRRDVKRIIFPDGQAELQLHVCREKGWRFADFSVPGLTEARVVRLVEDGGPTEADKEARFAAAEACDRDGLRALWEWCKLPVSDPHSVPEDMWAVYGEEHNQAIEDAFRVGAPSVQISIGIRNYEITFRGVSEGRQEDKAMRKRRLVRRRTVTPTEREFLLSTDTNATVDPDLADEECAICCVAFAETPAMPVVRLPGCGHCFHGACVQHIADKGGTCPFCRAEVDWAEALRPQARAPASPSSGGGGGFFDMSD